MAIAKDHQCAALIVDDDPDVQAMLTIALEADGYIVGSATDGAAALHYLRSHAETCVILLDLMLPGMDGAQFRAAQLRDRSLAWIPVVAMSAAIDADRRARELSARVLIRKPLDLDDVRRALRAVSTCQLRPRR